MKVLLIIPPFSQVNTCYPSVTQLTGFLISKGYNSVSSDLSLNVFLRVFSKEGFKKIFDSVDLKDVNDFYSERILLLKNSYINSVEPIIKFLQGKDPNLAYKIVNEKFIPQGESFENISDELEAFGYFGIQDKAKYYASLFLSDFTKFIHKNITEHFGLSRYAEKISISTPVFETINREVQRERNIIENFIVEETDKIITKEIPDLVGFSIPFPGNLLGAIISAKFLRENFPQIKIVFGGGYVNTELRKLQDSQFFEYTDYVTLDDGEIPILNIIQNIENPQRDIFVRTFILNKGKVEFRNDGFPQNIIHNELSPPNLNGIDPEKYAAITELLNPMHRLWSDGFWNKLTIAHGCYWRKCTFCDVSLDYIGRYSPAKASVIVDWIEAMIDQTGMTSFHFTDEAAPPSVLKEVAIEILRRNLSITWWGNIRFEKSFTLDLCRLLAASGCVAVSGGLEVADERLLKLIQKGVTLKQVAIVCNNFKEAGIMIHTYLMYGFPTQTEQEIVNSLELVRQFMHLNLFQSAYWHLFSLTVHSPIAEKPDKYELEIQSNTNNPFGNNDLAFRTKLEIDYRKFSFGLKKALYNFMHGVGFDKSVETWFDFQTRKTTISSNLISDFIENQKADIKENAKSIWLGSSPLIKKINNDYSEVYVSFNDLDAVWELDPLTAEWLKNNIQKSLVENHSYNEWISSFPYGSKEFSLFTQTEIWEEIRKYGLLFV
jgi:radical SAM superfamily enzyme YgiQ (UPF0313 family)